MFRKKAFAIGLSLYSIAGISILLAHGMGGGQRSSQSSVRVQTRTFNAPRQQGYYQPQQQGYYQPQQQGYYQPQQQGYYQPQSTPQQRYQQYLSSETEEQRWERIKRESEESKVMAQLESEEDTYSTIAEGSLVLGAVGAGFILLTIFLI